MIGRQVIATTLAGAVFFWFAALALGGIAFIWDGGGAGDDWFDDENWDQPGVPETSNDSATISNGDTAEIAPTTAGAEVGILTLGQQSGEFGGLSVTDGTPAVDLKVWTVLYAGLAGKGVCTHSGANVEAHSVTLGRYAGAHPNDGGWYYLINGGTLTCTSSVTVADEGYGRFVMQSQSPQLQITAASLHVGMGATGEGEFVIDDGQIDISNGYLAVGKGLQGQANTTQGTFTQNGGIVDVGTHVYLGREEGTRGECYLNDGVMRVDGNFYVGYHGAGRLEQTESATLRIGGEMIVGEDGEVPEPPSGQPTVTLWNSFINKSTTETNLPGLRHLNFAFETAGSGTFEVAGTMGAGFTDNFAMGKVTVADGFALKFVDIFDNGNRAAFGKESLFTYALDIADDGGSGGGSLDVWAYYTYVDSNVEAQLDTWIADGRLFSSLGPIDAIYVPCDDWTYVTPEPATLGLLAVGGLALLRRRRRA